MKKMLLTLVLTGLSISLFAQNFVNTEPQRRNVVLEEYTGVGCTWCPDGHAIINKYGDTVTAGDVIAINIHQGLLFSTNPSFSNYYKTEWSDSLYLQTNRKGYPSGAINRKKVDDTIAGYDRGQWVAQGNLVLKDTSYVNVAAKVDYDYITRKLNINVEAYYTGEAEGENVLHIMLLQNNVIGEQEGAFRNPAQVISGKIYRHMHMLRDVLSGWSGYTITNTNQGDLFEKTYAYTLPKNYYGIDFEPANLEVALFITDKDGLIVTGTKAVPEISEEFVSISYMDHYYTSSCNDSLAGAYFQIDNIKGESVQSLEYEYEFKGEKKTIEWKASTAVSQGEQDTIVLPFLKVTPNKSEVLVVKLLKKNGVNLVHQLTDTINIIKEVAESEGQLVLHLKQDAMGHEISWKLLAEDGNVEQTKNYETLIYDKDSLEVTSNVRSSTGCHRFEMHDSGNNGFSSYYVSGSYYMQDSLKNKVIDSDAKFRGKKVHYINVKTPSPLTIKGVPENIKSFEFYPNPSKGNTVYINLELKEAVKGQISVHNIVGKEVLRLPEEIYSSNKTISLNVSNLTSGVYFIRLSTPEGAAARKLIITK